MFYEKHQNAAGSMITVTSTSTGVFDLVNTAASTALARAGFSSEVNAIDIMPEDGDIRVLWRGLDPTATEGMLLSKGVGYTLRNVPLDSMKLIRVGAVDVSCNVQIGKSVPGESSSAVAVSTELEAAVSGTYNLAAPTLSDGESDDLQLDVNANLKTTLATGLNSTDDSVEAFVAGNANVTGCDTLFDSDGDNTAQQLKATGGNLYKVDVYNSNGTAAFVQMFDAVTGSVTVGTTTPKYVFFIPAGGAASMDLVVPVSFSTAITYACTTTPTGNGDPTAGLTCSFGYK